LGTLEEMRSTRRTTSAPDATLLKKTRPTRWRRPAIALILALGVLVGLAALGGEAAENYASKPLDAPVERALSGAREAWVTDLMRIVTHAGASAFLIPLVAVFGFARWVRTGSWRPLGMLAAAYGGSLALNWSVKLIVARPRPVQENPIERFTGSAFPSGHAAKAIAVLVVLAGVLELRSAPPMGRVIAWSVAVSISLLVGASRLFLGAHWLSDVLGGLTFGCLWALAVLRLVPRERPELVPTGSEI
jgi:membrane-associated phospholipid phosphatase